MNILTSQIHKQKPDIQETVCQIHKLEAIAIDLDTSEKVEKMNNNKISTIQDANDRILSLKSQKKENKIKEIQMRLDYFKNILDQIMNFKSTVDNTLEKLYSQIKAQIHTIQKEKQSVLESVQIQKDFLEDLKSLSEFLSADSQDKQFEFSSDDQFIDEVFKQFQLLFNNSEYFQTVDAFKEAKQKIIEVKENIKIELILQKNKNNQKTLSLNKACPTHNKEIIMIDIDTKNKNIQDRFVCVDCISDHPHCQYRTIEKVNQDWNNLQQSQDQVLNDLPITKTIDNCIFKKTSIEGLNHNELVSNLTYLIQSNKENKSQDQKIEYLKSKDSLFSKEIENKFEHLKQHNQLDIQESLNILQDENNRSVITVLLQKIQEYTNGNQEQLIMKQELEEILNSSQQIYCQNGLINQTIHKFQEHLAKINNINNKIESIPYHKNHANLQKWLHDYTDQFQKDFNKLKKFCEIENLEKRLITLHLDYEQLQQESKRKIEDQNKKIDQLKEFEKEIQLKLRIYGDDNLFLKNKLIEVQNNYDNQLKEEQIKNQNYVQKLNQKISSQDSLINQVKTELDLRIQMFEPIIKLKPKLLKEDFWIKLFFVLQEKCKKKITSLGEIKLDCNNNSSFWKACNDKSNLLIIFKSLSGYIFGGYSPCLWNQNEGFVQDDTLSSFLFSQTHDQIYPLKQDKKQYAIWCGYSYGPCFGSNDDGQHDIVVKADFQGGYSQLGNAYLWDKSENKRSSHLYGQDSPNLTECEIFELKFS